ncbi:ribbon-helix-helix protein, CopG family [Neiella marina]|uniref:Ribbon-helix-helix protein, CopG family n=1 Tax=Neiella holothuriorum TaxID=2870530 RepID=A0ABS7ED33_9GAMM|nr:ribbon-helix-helix protein, CopG family [Neiella holothuriorum]MBW8190248.1 ribbon-helix-helix protein, CopG family [Neiella holothuriorum]
MAKDKNSKDGKKNTSLRLESKTLKALKIRAIEEDTSVQQIIEKLINNYLDGDKKKK